MGNFIVLKIIFLSPCHVTQVQPHTGDIGIGRKPKKKSFDVPTPEELIQKP
jgi:hypothetical protein